MSSMFPRTKRPPTIPGIPHFKQRLGSTEATKQGVLPEEQAAQLPALQERVLPPVVRGSGTVQLIHWASMVYPKNRIFNRNNLEELGYANAHKSLSFVHNPGEMSNGTSDGSADEVSDAAPDTKPAPGLDIRKGDAEPQVAPVSAPSYCTEIQDAKSNNGVNRANDASSSTSLFKKIDPNQGENEPVSVGSIVKETVDDTGSGTGKTPPKQQEFVVEAILRHRTPRGQLGVTEFLVKWQGYPASGNTWEDARSFVEPDRTFTEQFGTYVEKTPGLSCEELLDWALEQMKHAD